MNKKRLEESASYLENLQLGRDDEFDMMTWWRETVPTEPGDSCGTAACALGWLTYRFDELSLVGQKRGGWDVTFESSINYEAAERFFDITPKMVHYIFDGENYENYLSSDGVSKEQVTARMRDLVKDNG